ncbi:MAG: hypothetical protein EP314_03640, partial [Bacteroidetes bacterium]
EFLKGNRSKYVYLIRNNLTGLYKIGNSIEPYRRERTLQSREPDIDMIILRKSPYTVETKLHQKYKSKRQRGEWFELSIKDVKDIEKFILFETS